MESIRRLTSNDVAMSSKITFIVPQIKQASGEGTQLWVEQLAELRLLADVQVVLVPWQEEHAGSVMDWIATVQLIAKYWQESDGFVIWAPQHSLLGLSGSLRLMFPKPGKPVILFAAEKPVVVHKSKQKLLGLKSALINAVYLAQSDMAEVLVLSERSVFRPQYCAWGQDSKNLEVISSQTPLARIDFRLEVFDRHLPRGKTPALTMPPTNFTEKLKVAHWFPGLKPELSLSSDEAAIIMTNADFWGHPDILQLQKELQQQKVPVIWYSPRAWKTQAKFSGTEIAISHEQPWWVALSAQFALGNNPSLTKAFTVLQAQCS